MKYKKTTVLAWIIFAAIAALVLFNLVTLLANTGSIQDLLQLVSGVLWTVMAAEFAFLAALILSYQPHNLIGWLLMMPGIALASDVFKNYFARLPVAPLDPTPAAMLALWFSAWSWLLLMFPIFLILLLFPTGRPLSPRWRWASFYVLGVCAFFFIEIAFQKEITSDTGAWSLANPIGFIPVNWVEKYFALPFAFGLLSMTVLGVISMVVRYRRAQAVEREQIKWLLYACGLFAVTYILIIFLVFNSPQWGAGPGWVYLLNALGVMAIPAAIAIAILRYRLWEIDIIIQRSLVYGALTLTLALIYFGSVVLLENIFRPLLGGTNQLAIVASTLLIAALFSPLRRRIQNDIDRRFYRKKYNAVQALETFSAKIRDEVELDELTAHLLGVVEETMQPANVSLWLVKDRRQGGIDTR